MMDESIHHNIHGVNLNDIEAGDRKPFQADHGGRELGYVHYANVVEDEFHVEYWTAYGSTEHIIRGDRFRQRVGVRTPITDDELDELDEGDSVSIYATGHEQSTRAFVEEVDFEERKVRVNGECNAQTLSRWVEQSLIRSPSR